MCSNDGDWEVEDLPIVIDHALHAGEIIDEKWIVRGQFTQEDEVIDSLERHEEGRKLVLVKASDELGFWYILESTKATYGKWPSCEGCRHHTPPIQCELSNAMLPLFCTRHPISCLYSAHGHFSKDPTAVDLYELKDGADWSTKAIRDQPAKVDQSDHMPDETRRMLDSMLDDILKEAAISPGMREDPQWLKMRVDDLRAFIDQH